MYEDTCYETPFIKEVVVRIDFVAPIAELTRSLPTKLANAATAHFPIAEPSKTIAQELQFGPAPQLRQIEVLEWHFFGKEREKRLTFSAGSILAQYTKYKSFEEMEADVLGVIEALKAQFPDVRANRVGIRFINQIEVEGHGDPFSWSGYVNQGLLCTFEHFAGERDAVTRLLSLAEFRYDDVKVRFQFGNPNLDYPAVLKRPTFVLDFDAYAEGAHELNASIEYIRDGHARIQHLFELNITDELRGLMHAKH